MNKNIDKLLEYLFISEQHQEQEEQKEEEKENLPLGKFVFADPSMGLRKDGVKEKDTDSEKQLLGALDNWYNSGSGSNLISVFPKIKDLMNSGVEEYEKIFSPPKNDTVYRTIKLRREEISKLLSIDIKKIVEDTTKEGQNIITYHDKFILHPIDNFPPIQSWTIDKNNIKNFISVEKIKPEPDIKYGLLNVIFKANTSNHSNKFFMNPREMEKKFKPEGPFYFQNEQEVISIGPVECESATIIVPFVRIVSSYNLDQVKAAKNTIISKIP